MSDDSLVGRSVENLARVAPFGLVCRHGAGAWGGDYVCSRCGTCYVCAHRLDGTVWTCPDGRSHEATMEESAPEVEYARDEKGNWVTMRALVPGLECTYEEARSGT